ncbi:MAG: DUF2393 domain-containing protein [Campylobacter sp.]|nr:DUF2393 domain-containing protein [Campylobacter sp.]
MSANYFSIVHILVLVVIGVISFLLFILSFKADRKIFFPLLFTNVLVTVCLSVFLMIVLDKYTKKGKLEDLKSQRILRNESIVFSGKVRNVGQFTISKCNLVVKLINQPLNKDTLKGEALFKPSGMKLFSWLFNDSNSKPNTVEYKFTIVRDLESKKSLPFSVAMPYPPYFTNGMNITKLYCH